MATKQHWPRVETLAEARALYADLEQQKRDVDGELREMGRAARAKPVRLRSNYWIRRAELLYTAICDEQKRLLARYGAVVKRPVDFGGSEDQQ
jgi:hypothetical protein